MLGGITGTLLIGLPPLPAPPPLVNALQKVEIETSTDVASAFRLRFGMTQQLGFDWDLVGPQYEETLFRPFMPVQIRVKVGIEIPETRRRELRPVAIQGGDFLLLQARDRELDFLVAQSVVAVVGPGDDPE